MKRQFERISEVEKREREREKIGAVKVKLAAFMWRKRSVKSL